MNVFDILGPVMIGPSSSHTAGAARIGKMAEIILGESPVRAEITLHGSFAQTHRGHGTDRALVGGLLGFGADDERLVQALDIAVRRGLAVTFRKENLGEVHPNTARILATGASGKTVDVVASSIGGGDIKVIGLNGFKVDFDGQLPTLVVPHHDRPGSVAAVTTVLAQYRVNIAHMQVAREEPGSDAIMIIETDEPCDPGAVAEIAQLPSVYSVSVVEPL